MNCDENINTIIKHLVVKAAEERENIIMREIQLIGGEEYEAITIDKNKVIEALRMYAEKDNYIKLPCKVVDTVYCIDGDNTISKWYVAGFKKYHNMAWSCDVRDNLNKWNHQDRAILFSAFGKTVFLTREEAEKALKEQKK